MLTGSGEAYCVSSQVRAEGSSDSASSTWRHYSDVLLRDYHIGMICDTAQLVLRSLYALPGDELPAGSEPHPVDTLHTPCINFKNGRDEGLFDYWHNEHY